MKETRLILKGPWEFAAVIPLVILALVLGGGEAQANTITFSTGVISTSGGPVNAQATFITGATSLRILVTNLLVNPTDAAQLISDVAWTFGPGGPTTGNLVSGLSGPVSVPTTTVAAGGSFTPGAATSPAGWALGTATVGGNPGMEICIIAETSCNPGPGVTPSHLIIGPPAPSDGTGGYTAANGSIAGNGPHNPFLGSGVVEFDINNIPGVNSDTAVTGAFISFGTAAGVNVAACPPSITACGGLITGTTPEPSALLLVGSGLLGGWGMAALRKRRSRP